MTQAVATPPDEQVRARGENWFEHWDTEVSKAFVPLQSVPREPEDPAFAEGLHCQMLGRVQLAEVPGGAVNVERTPKLIRRAEPEFIKLGLQVQGPCRIEQRDRQVVLNPGDFALYETGVPYRLEFPERFRMLVFMFPRSLLRCPDRFVDAIASRRIGGDQGIGALVSPLLRTLDEQLRSRTLPARAEVADAVLSLVAASVGEELRDELCDADNPVLIRAQSFIEAQVGNPDLDTRMIADALQVSVRYLQKLFERNGDSVAAYIRRHRLERCRQDLANPDFAAESIGAIAGRYGLTDPSHFSRIFKEAYSESPRDFRRQRKAGG